VTGSRDAELLEVVPLEAPRPARTRAGRRPRRETSVVTRAALAGLGVGLGISLVIAGVEGGEASPAEAQVPNRVDRVVRPPTVRAFAALDVSSVNGIRTASLPWRFGRAAFTLRCVGKARVLDADVWALASSVTYRWVIAELGNIQLFQSIASTPSVRARILVGKGSTERLVPEQSRDFLRLVTRMTFTAPLDGLFARPVLVVNARIEAPELGWVVAAPDDVVTLLRQRCA
jgi:hypothetical protein